MPGTLVGTVRGLFACASVKASDGTLTNNRGFASCVHTGTGDHLLTLQQGLTLKDDNGGLCFIQSFGTAGTISTVVQASATTLQVLTTTHAGAPADLDFNIMIQDVGPV